MLNVKEFEHKMLQGLLAAGNLKEVINDES